MMRSVNSNRQINAFTSSQQTQKSHKKLGLTSSNSKNKNISTSVASMTSSLKKSSHNELKSSGRKYGMGSGSNSNSNKSLKGVKEVISNPLYQQLKRQQAQNKQNNMDKKGTIPVKNIKQRICGIGLKEDTNIHSRMNINNNAQNANSSNNINTIKGYQGIVSSSNGSIVGMGSTNSIINNNKKFAEIIHHNQNKEKSMQKQTLCMGMAGKSVSKNYYLNNNKDSKITIKSKENLNTNLNKPSKNNSQLLNFTSALHTQQCEDGLNSNITPRPSLQETLSLEQFQLGRKLGKGRFGDVFMAREIRTGFALAIKIINKKELKESQMQKQLIQEIKIQMYSNHPNILKMYGFFSDKNKIYLILELATNGCLFKQIKKKSYLPENLSSFYFRQVTSGVRYLHSNSVIHRDIKPQNILNCFNVLKLCDFGWAIYSPIYQRQTFCGTLDYVPPEIVTGDYYDEKADVWCLGVLCYQLCTGKAPFESTTDQNQTYDKILKVNIEFPIYLSAQIVDFIGKILTRDPSKRLGLEEVQAHEWMRMYENEAGRMISKQIWDSWIDLTKN